MPLAKHPSHPTFLSAETTYWCLRAIDSKYSVIKNRDMCIQSRHDADRLGHMLVSSGPLSVHAREVDPFNFDWTVAELFDKLIQFFRIIFR